MQNGLSRTQNSEIILYYRQVMIKSVFFRPFFDTAKMHSFNIIEVKVKHPKGATMVFGKSLFRPFGAFRSSRNCLSGYSFPGPFFAIIFMINIVVLRPTSSRKDGIGDIPMPILLLYIELYARRKNRRRPINPKCRECL